MHRTIRIAAALGLVLGFVPWIAPAVAQGPGGGGRGGAGGGPGGGRGGGMPGFGMFGGGQFTSPTTVVNTPEVQKELALTDKQIASLKEIQDKANNKRRDIFQQFMPNFGRGRGGPGAGFGGGPNGGPNGGQTGGRGYGAQGPAQAAGGQTGNGGAPAVGAGANGGRQAGTQPTNGGFGGGQGGAPGGPAGFGGGQGGGGRGNRGGGQAGPGGGFGGAAGGGPGGGFGGAPGGGFGGAPGGGFGGAPGGGPGGQGGPGGRGRPQLTPEQQANFQAMGEAMSTFQKQYEASIMKILDPKQRKRLMEIVYQMDGPRVMTRPDFVSKLNLQEDQQEHVQSVLQELQGAQRQLMTASRNNGPQFLDANGRPDRQKMREYMQSKEGQAQREKDQKARAKLNDLALTTMTKILSNSQRNTFKKMIGAKFDVRSITFNRRGGPGGQNQPNANGTRTQPGGNRTAAGADDDDPDEDKPATKAATPAPAAKATKNARKSLRSARGLGDDA